MDRELCVKLPKKRPYSSAVCCWTLWARQRVEGDGEEGSAMCVILRRILDSILTCLTVVPMLRSSRPQQPYQVITYSCSLSMTENSQKFSKRWKGIFWCWEAIYFSEVPHMGFGLTPCNGTEKKNIHNLFEMMMTAVLSLLRLVIPSYTYLSCQLFPKDMDRSSIM